ncbi:MAG: malto-oligosyltrehalose synthase, partial [Propionibacterium sp.]|nr:malto-oligosyltrehalose synthase [Propionibacterium sp.]
MADPHPHLPHIGRHTPLTTYRLQLTPDFTFGDAAGVLPYLVDLGVTDVYLSPILQPVPGSRHGYDVVDHTHVNAELGGRSAFEAFTTRAHSLGLHIVVDIVPNHMAVPTPVWQNRAMWSVLKLGAKSPYARWFDVEDGQQFLMPVLGARIGQVLTRGELELTRMEIPTEPEEGEQWVLRYYDHVFPVAGGTESLPMHVLLERQTYRLAHWKVGDEELNYRRFFDVDTLAGIRVERPEVFDATHALLFDLFDAGHIDSFRVDHPDGLADPRGYFQRLWDRTGGAWTAAEKILGSEEMLPADWPVCGTTGYDTSWRIHALQVDPGAAMPLGAVMQEIAGDSPSSFPKVVSAAKRDVIDTSLSAEVRRLANLVWEICQRDLRLRDHTFRSIVECLRALIVEMDRYRAYVVPGTATPQSSRDVLTAARDRAFLGLDPDLEDTLDVLLALVQGDEVGSAGLSTRDDRRSEVVVRFQQVCGAVMAKGVEDTAFYRWTHLVSLTEVGGVPDRFGLDLDAFHAFESQLQENWPATMTAGTTHDSKRGEDVRARLAAFTCYPLEWAALVQELRFVTEPRRPAQLDGRAENLLWQTLAATWTDTDAMTASRLEAYLTKASREQKTWTSWTSPDTEREEEFLGFATTCLADDAVISLLDAWHARTASAQRTCVLVTKALQMTVPGVADIYQGSEVTRTSLVDPDNRRPVDFEDLAVSLTRVREGHHEDLDDQKLRLTSAIAHLRQREKWAFVSPESTYTALPTSSGHAVAFARGDHTGPRALTIAMRLPRTLADIGGWEEHTVVLPEGHWHDILSGRTHAGGAVRLANLLGTEPVVLLEAQGTPEGAPVPHPQTTTQSVSAATSQSPRTTAAVPADATQGAPGGRPGDK